ncbi:hypothetical protein Tco_0684295 [Tanacetum coccineum]
MTLNEFGKDEILRTLAWQPIAVVALKSNGVGFDHGLFFITAIRDEPGYHIIDLDVDIFNDIKAMWVKLGVCIHIEVVLYSDSLLTPYKGSKYITFELLESIKLCFKCRHVAIGVLYSIIILHLSEIVFIVKELLSSDEFHADLARVASLGINYGVERGLRMGRTDVEFEAAVQKVSNFHVGAKADFDKALVDFPTTPFPFLSNIVAASEGGLPNVAQILPDKFTHSATSVSVASSSASEAPEQVSP